MRLLFSLLVALLLGPLGAWSAPALATEASPSVAPSEAPLETHTPEPMGREAGDIPILPYLIQLIVVTGVVAGLGYVSLKFLKDKAPGMGLGLATGKQIKVIDKVAVDPKRMMMLVNVGGRYFLLAATETQVTTVAELSKQDLGGEFAQLLEQEKHRGEAL